MKCIWLVIASGLFIGCSGHPASPAGVYFGHYGGASECIEIMADGTYRQVLVKDGIIVYNNTADWTSGITSDDIKLNNCYVAVDLTKAQQIRSPNSLPFSPEKYSVVGFSYGSSSGERWICAAPDTFYFLTTDSNSPVLSATQYADEYRPPEK